MRGTLRKLGIAVATIVAIVGTTVALSESADARWGGGHGTAAMAVGAGADSV